MFMYDFFFLCSLPSPFLAVVSVFRTVDFRTIASIFFASFYYLFILLILFYSGKFQMYRSFVPGWKFKISCICGSVYVMRECENIVEKHKKMWRKSWMARGLKNEWFDNDWRRMWGMQKTKNIPEFLCIFLFIIENVLGLFLKSIHG